MNKILKRILIGLGIFILVLVAAVAVLFIVIDPNDYRDELSAMAHKATGRQIEFKGDIGLKIIPSLAFSIKDVNVAQPAGFGEAPMAHVQELSLKMSLFPLLKKQVQVSAISLDGLTLNLVKDAKGRHNWEVTDAASAQAPSAGSSGAGSSGAGSPGQAAPQQGSAPGASSNTGGGNIPATGDSAEAQKRMESLLQSRIDSVSISNCVLNYEDKAARESMQVRLNKLDLGNVGLNRDITCALDVAAALGKDMQAAFTMSGQARYELAQELLKLDIKSFVASVEAPAMLASRQEIKGSLTALTNGKSGEASFKAVLESAFLNGSADLAAAGSSLKGNVDLKSKPVLLVKSLSASMQKELGLAPELLAENGPLRSLDSKLAFSVNGKNVNVSNAELRLGGSDMLVSLPALKAVLANSGGLSSAEGSVSIKGSLRPYLPLAGIEPAKGNALSKLDGGFAFKLAGDNLSVTGLKLLIDETLVNLAAQKMDVRLAPSGPLLPINSLKTDLTIAAKPRELMNALAMPPDTADPKALAAFQSSFNLALDNSSLKLTNLKGKLDETDITALVELLLPGAKGIPKGATSYAKADIQMGTLNLDRYLAPESASSAPAPSKPGDEKSGGSKAGGPLKGTPLEKARAEFTAGIKSLTIKKAPVQNIALNCVLADGVLTVSKASLQSFNGQFSLTAKADLVNAAAQNTLTASLTGLDIGNALTAMLDEKRLGGNATGSLDFSFKGLDANSILSSLSGKGALNVTNGVLKDFQLIPQDAPALLLKHRVSDYQFSDFGGSFTAKEGKLNNNDLKFTGKNFNLTGKGSLALVDRSLDYSGVINTKEAGDIPLRITGPVNSLKITLDQEAIAKMAAEKGKEALTKELQKQGVVPQGSSEERREAAKQQAEESKKQIDQKIQKGLEDLLKKK